MSAGRRCRTTAPLSYLRLAVFLPVKIENVPLRVPAEMPAQLGGQDRALKRRPVRRQWRVVGMMLAQPTGEWLEAGDLGGGKVIRLEPGPRVLQRQRIAYGDVDGVDVGGEAVGARLRLAHARRPIVVVRLDRHPREPERRH